MANLKEIIKQKQAAEAELFKLPGVTAVDVGYKYVKGQRTDEITIRVHVEKKKKDVAKKDMVPAEIAGIKTDVLENSFEPFTTKMGLDEITLQADTTKYSPVKGGISIGPERVINGFVYTGTLGCIVKDNVSGNPYLLSNFHVMCVNNTWAVGDQMDQPSRVDGGTPVTDRVGTLQRAVLSGHVDGAVSSLSGRTHDCSIVDIGDVKGKDAAVLNAAVRKRGRTTLLTHGFVDSINLTVNINYGAGIGVKTLTDQIGIRPDTAQNSHFSKSGDSGSVVVNSANKVIGLLFAGNASTGYTIINPINFVLSELNISLCVKPTKSIFKDIKDGHKDFFKDGIKDFKEGKEFIKDKKEFKEGKELIKDKKEFKEGKELIKDKKEFKEGIKEFKENIKEFKELEKVLPDFPGKGIRENPGDFNPGRPIEFSEGSNAPEGTVEDRLGSIEQTLSELTAFIAGNLRPDLTQGALTNEADYGQWQQAAQKEEQDNLGAKYQADNMNG